MASGVPRCIDGTQAGQQLVFVALQFPVMLAGKVIGEVGVVRLGAGGGEFRFVYMHVAAAQLAQAAGVIEMQMTEENQVDIRWRKPMPGEVDG